MKRTNQWINALFALIFIAVPAMVAFVFWVPYWDIADEQPYWFYWALSGGFIIYVALLSWLLIHFEVLYLDSLNFNVPITLVFVSLFVSYEWHMAIRVILVVLMVLVALPITIWTNYKMAKRALKNSIRKTR